MVAMIAAVMAMVMAACEFCQCFDDQFIYIGL